MDKNELYHYGVKGMRWGHRRALRRDAKRQYRSDTNKAYDEYERTIASIEKPYRRGQNLSKADMKREAAAEKKYNNAVSKAKDNYKKAKVTAKTKARAEHALAKIEKQKKKDYIKSRSKEIQKGSSAVDKMWNSATGAHKIQAELEYDLQDRED